uniref:Uncharacterized protein n=1 Tax=Anguilla anguilla TaxID=7936 RepID=A0A0E9Q0T6_ANGAN
MAPFPLTTRTSVSQNSGLIHGELDIRPTLIYLPSRLSSPEPMG